MNIGNKIKRMRELKGLKQEYIADQLHMTQSNYSRIENNQVKIKYELLLKVAHVLGTTPDSITNFDVQALSNTEKDLYERCITILREENQHLKEILGHLRSQERRKDPEKIEM